MAKHGRRRNIAVVTTAPVFMGRLQTKAKDVLEPTEGMIYQTKGKWVFRWMNK